MDKNSLASKIAYQWQLTPSSGVTIPNTISPLLLIPAQQLVGGRQYTATVVVAMQQDPTLSVTTSAVIDTISSDVVAVIKGKPTFHCYWYVSMYLISSDRHHQFRCCCSDKRMSLLLLVVVRFP